MEAMNVAETSTKTHGELRGIAETAKELVTVQGADREA